jgi:hypothetical protein
VKRLSENAHLPFDGLKALSFAEGFLENKNIGKRLSPVNNNGVRGVISVIYWVLTG